MHQEEFHTDNYRLIRFPDLERLPMRAGPWQEILDIMEKEKKAGWEVIEFNRGFIGILLRRKDAS